MSDTPIQGEHEPMLVTFPQPDNAELCPIAFVLDTNPTTTQERIENAEQALHVAMTMMRGPGSLVTANEATPYCVVDFPLDEALGEVDEQFVVEIDGVAHLRVMLVDADTALRETMTKHLVTRFVANADHLVTETIIVMTRKSATNIPTMHDEMGDHIIAHLHDLLVEYGIDPSSDVVTVSTDRVIEIDGTTINPTIIERVFDDRVSSSLNMLGVVLDQVTPPRTSRAH